MSQIEDHDHWIARGLDEDFGVDAEAELTEDGLLGHILKLQFKSSERVERRDGLIRLTIDRKYIGYAKSCRYPVVLVWIDITNRQAWYLWLQDWILDQRSSGERLERQQTYTVWIDERHTLDSGLDGSLKEIARWRGETQLILSLLDTMRAAAATYNQHIMEQIASLLSAVAPTVADTSLDVIAGEAALLGDRLRGTHEGNIIATQLFSLVRSYGNRVTILSIDALVCRAEKYSRTGIGALGILYDEFFDHMISLGLPDYFESKNLPEVAYYCALRENDLNKKSFDFIMGPGDFTYAGLKFDCPEDDRIWDKFANRGPSAILDYLVWEHPVETPID